MWARLCLRSSEREDADRNALKHIAVAMLFDLQEKSGANVCPYSLRKVVVVHAACGANR